MMTLEPEPPGWLDADHVDSIEWHPDRQTPTWQECRRHADDLRREADATLARERYDQARQLRADADALEILAELRRQGNTTVTLDDARASLADQYMEAALDRPALGAYRTQLASDPGVYIDWTHFWDTDGPEHEWLVDRVLARGRGHAIYAARKLGKSLIVLALVVDLAVTAKDVTVIYLDFEMAEDDLRERLEDMGYGPDTDLSRLRYALLPSLPPLDTPAGAQRLLELVDAEIARDPDCLFLVIIDTTARAVQGAENEADTFRDFYRHTGLALKQRGVTYARIDHSGHDPSRQRGSSAKGDDVDVVWRLERADNGYTLRRDAARMSWVPERVGLERLEGPLRFVLADASWPPGTYELADVLAGLHVPPDSTVKAARSALRTIGRTASNQVLAAAVKYRKGAVDNHRSGDGTPHGTPFQTLDGAYSGPDWNALDTRPGTGSGTPRNESSGEYGTFPPYIGGNGTPEPEPWTEGEVF